MESARTWQETLQRLTEQGFRVVPLDTSVTLSEMQRVIGEAPPGNVIEFCRLWQKNHDEPWKDFVGSITLGDTPVRREIEEIATSYPLRRLINRAEYAAIVWGNRAALVSPDPWAYLLQLQPKRPDADPGHIRLHLPADPSSIIAAESVLGMTLPPSYTQVLVLTNGLGLDFSGYESIAGAGPQRAVWEPVVANDWLHCSHYQEVTALWREFQGNIASEREREQEEGVNTFLSDEGPLVPFLWTAYGDIWCFDRSRQQEDGEYPIIFWDHEMREATEQYPNFTHWMEHQLERKVFGKE
ncbi:MAG TPA: SMI1/KNR4 family protein [Ktedonobacteraceae bacterium]|nr:SMI1/KNR4 family protein [Ktedonobacteraceae bacterium]